MSPPRYRAPPVPSHSSTPLQALCSALDQHYPNATELHQQVRKWLLSRLPGPAERRILVEQLLGTPHTAIMRLVIEPPASIVLDPMDSALLVRCLLRSFKWDPTACHAVLATHLDAWQGPAETLLFDMALEDATGNGIAWLWSRTSLADKQAWARDVMAQHEWAKLDVIAERYPADPWWATLDPLLPPAVLERPVHVARQLRQVVPLAKVAAPRPVRI